jgi:hypothetical protein
MPPRIKPIRCRDRQCRREIAIIAGSHERITCPFCSKEQKVYTEHKGFRVTIRNNMAAR